MGVKGAGAAGIACLELLKSMGLPHENAILCDSKGPIYIGRDENINQWKAAHAVDTDARSLADAIKGSDIFLGLSVKDALTKEMLETMNKDPIVFAMANPDPEIDPKLAKEVRESFRYLLEFKGKLVHKRQDTIIVHQMQVIKEVLAQNHPEVWLDVRKQMEEKMA